MSVITAVRISILTSKNVDAGKEEHTGSGRENIAQCLHHHSSLQFIDDDAINIEVEQDGTLIAVYECLVPRFTIRVVDTEVNETGMVRSVIPTNNLAFLRRLTNIQLLVDIVQEDEASGLEHVVERCLFSAKEHQVQLRVFHPLS